MPSNNSNITQNDFFTLITAMAREVDKGHSVFLISEDKKPYANCEDCPNSVGPNDPHRDTCPCLPRNGGSNLCHGFHSSTQDSAILMGWAQNYPNAQLAVATGPVSNNEIGLEYDPDHGGLESWTELLAEYGDLPLTRVDRSPSGGEHWWFRLPEGISSQNIHGKLKRGIDIKADGGYMLVPPSTGYTTVVEAPVAAAPQWLVDFIHRTMNPEPTPRLRERKIADFDLDDNSVKETAQATAKYWLGRVVNAEDGVQNTLLYVAGRVMGSLVAYELADEEDALALLEEAAEEGGHPRYRALPTINSGFNAGLNNPDPLDDLVNPDRNVIKAFTWDDMGNASRVAFWRGEDIRYDRVRDAFYVWNGTHWDESGPAEIRSIVTEVIKQITASEAKFYCNTDLQGSTNPKTTRERFQAWAATQRMSRRVTDTVTALKSLPELWCTNEEFDQQPYKLNLANGVLDLRTGETTPHAREYMFTVTLDTAYDAKATCDNWERFMKIVMPKKEHREYLQRLAGMTIIGEILDQVFVLNVGEGGLGKGVFLQVIEKILGSYAIRADRKAFINAGSQRTFEMYQWEGKRLVYTDEIGAAKLNGEFLKDITGGDKLIVEGKGLKHKEFTPQFTIWLRSNDIPDITNETAMERRFLLVRWLGKKLTSEQWNTFKDNENRIVPKFFYNTEASGILNWLLKGLQDYLKKGLNVPEDWDREAKQLLIEGDLKTQFLEETVERTDNPTDSVDTKELYKRFCEYFRESSGGEKPEGVIIFNRSMEKDYKMVRDYNNNRPRWTGVVLKKGVMK